MKKSNVCGRGKRVFLLFTKRILSAAAVGCVIAIISNSFITVEGTNGKSRYFISPFSQKELFEDSEVFDDILRKDVQDITRMSVIKSQLETNGEYEGKKEIDITAYVNRTSMLSESDVTAVYYLDDLIKWGNYGFNYETVYGTENDFAIYFGLGRSDTEMEIPSDLNVGDFSLQSDLTKQAIKYSNQAAESDSLSLRMIAELPDSLEGYMERASEKGEMTVDTEDVIALDILVPRYYSADGLDLADYASDIDEYLVLRANLVEACNQLYHNFTEYSSFKKFYGEDKTNIRYCYQMTVDGEARYFTNVSQNFAGKSEKEITEEFGGYGRYLYYNPDRVEIKTNTQMTTEDMRGILSTYEYVFAENSRVWIGVDTSYGVNDSMAQARNAFVSFMPYYWQTAVVGILALVMSLWLLGVLTVYEGRKEAENEDGYVVELKKGDRFPTEIFLVLGISVTAGYCVLCATAYEIAFGYTLEGGVSPFMMTAGGVLAAFLLDWVATSFYLGLVRRLKVHRFWRDSLLWQLGRIIRRLFFRLYDNSHIVSRILIPFLLIAAMNLLFGMLGVLGILAAGVIDVCVAVLLYQERKDLQRIVEGTLTIGEGDFGFKIDDSRMHGENKVLAEAVNSIGDGIQEAVATSMKDERLKADLITNVSHDIKTPLTSIINFVNLLKREDIRDEKIKGYIQVLDSKSQRLKQLTDDLVEASKISSGNISLQMEKINFVELINQTIGEFSEKMNEKCLTMVAAMPEKPVYIEADSRRIWRVAENLFGNVCKYALEGTRVYLDLAVKEKEGKKTAYFSMKNISAQSLNISADELTERFIRGDVSRSTEGSGLGLSIARNLTELQNGKFDIYLDGDLFKVILAFPCMEEKAVPEQGPASETEKMTKQNTPRE